MTVSCYYYVHQVEAAVFYFDMRTSAMILRQHSDRNGYQHIISQLIAVIYQEIPLPSNIFFAVGNPTKYKDCPSLSGASFWNCHPCVTDLTKEVSVIQAGRP